MELDQRGFYHLIREKTDDFVGREWVFDEIDNWLNDDSQNRLKYFIVTGKAGSGKSTIAARLIEISNGHTVNSNDENNIYPIYKKIIKDFLDGVYVVSFKDNKSTDPKTLSKSLASQLASKNEEFMKELMNSTNASKIYNININAAMQQIQAESVSGNVFNIQFNIQGSPTAISVFNDLVRTPLDSFLMKNPEKKLVFLIDGLDESITSSKEESYSDSIISILSNLDGLRNVYFIITTRDYENILNKFRKSSIEFNISSSKYTKYINDDVSTFIKLNLDKESLLEKAQSLDNKKIIDQLVDKVEGNFLYIKFVMDAIVEGKIEFSAEAINSIPSGLYGMYNLFFDRMVTQYGEDDWNLFYIPIIRTLLVSFDGLDVVQISFFTGIEDNLQKILNNLKPFIIIEEFYKDENRIFRYKLYHQSLEEFLKKRYFEDNSLNNFFISEQRAHKKIVERFYDKSNDVIKINLLAEYGLKYLAEHLSALVDYNDPEGIDWYSKLFQLAKNHEFEQKQLENFPHETDLPLRTINGAFEASLIKEDQVATAELLLFYDNHLKKVFTGSPFFVLEKISVTGRYIRTFDEVMENVYRIANLYNVESRTSWYLLIAWYFDCKNKIDGVNRTFENLFRKEITSVEINNDIVNFLIILLYPKYKENLNKLFDHIAIKGIIAISLHFLKNNHLSAGLEILEYMSMRKLENYDVLNKLHDGSLEQRYLIVARSINASSDLSNDEKFMILSSIIQVLAQSGKVDEAIKLAQSINDYIQRSRAFLSIAQTLAQSGKVDDALHTAKSIDYTYSRSEAFSSIAQTLAQSGKVDEAIKLAKSINEPDHRSEAFSSIAQALAQSGKVDEAQQLFDDALHTAKSIDYTYSRSEAFSSIAQTLAQSGKVDEAQQLFEESIEVAKSIGNSIGKSEALSFTAQTLAQSGKVDEAIKLAQSIDDSYNKSKAFSEILANKFDINDDTSKQILEDITIRLVKESQLIDMYLPKTPTTFWNYLLKQCINFPDLSYSMCSLIAKRYPDNANEIANLMLKYGQ